METKSVRDIISRLEEINESLGDAKPDKVSIEGIRRLGDEAQALLRELDEAVLPDGRTG